MSMVLEKVAKALTKKYDLALEFKGSSAYTDGKTIVLPALPAKVDDATMTVAKGYCDHEAAHVLFSDFSLPEKIMAKAGAAVKRATNAIEDVRVELLMARRYPGAAANMRATLESLLTEVPANPWALLNVGGRQALGMDVPFGVECMKGALDAFGADVFDKMAALSSSEDAYRLACELLHVDPETGEKMDEGDEGDEGESAEDDKKDEGGSEGGKGESRTAEEGAEGEGEGVEGEGEGEGAEGEGAEGEGEGAEGEGEGAEGEGAEGEGAEGEGAEGEGAEGEGDKASVTAEKDGADKGDGKSGDRPGHESGRTDGGADSKASTEALEKAASEYEDTFEKAGEKLEAASAEALERGQYLVFSKGHDMVQVVDEAKTEAAYNGIKAKLGNLNVMASKAATMFRARTASRWLNDREDGKVNARALARTAAGYQNIFREKMVSRDMDTAVTFLVDFSGSMNGHSGRAPIDHAMQAVVAFLETLTPAGVKTEVLGYTTAGTIPGAAESLDCLRFGRIERLMTYVFKTFNEPLNAKVKRRVGNYASLRLRENCDPDSVMLAAQRLMVRNEKRKVLFVLTDGAVVNKGNVMAGHKELKRLIPELEKSGLEVVGVGIGSGRRDVDEYYSKRIAVDGDSSRLPAQLLDALRQVLKV